MSVHDFSSLMEHAGHAVEVVPQGTYGDETSVILECEDCSEVLLNYEKYPEEVNSFTVTITEEDLKKFGIELDVPLDILTEFAEEIFQEEIFFRLMVQAYKRAKVTTYAD
jgi:hypothetical protein